MANPLEQLMMGMGGQMRGGGAAAAANTPLPDTSEKVIVSPLALLKMLKHARAGVPIEVMGLILGEFVDDYTVNVVDVFSMPQMGNSVSVEAVDPVFQTNMLEMLKTTGRPESVVGWYHSHPGFGCWLSSTDINTQQSFEQLNPRAIGIVVDPIQSVRGRVVIDCFRLIPPQLAMTGSSEAREITGNLGHLTKPSLTALVHGLNRHYYSIRVECRKSKAEEAVLLKIHKRHWTQALHVPEESTHAKQLSQLAQRTARMTKDYTTRIEDEITMTESDLAVKNVGKLDPKTQLKNDSTDLLVASISHALRSHVFRTAFRSCKP